MVNSTSTSIIDKKEEAQIAENDKVVEKALVTENNKITDKVEVADVAYKENDNVTVKVSVLLPIYNTNTVYLEQAISSILNQTYRDFELLILNDSPNNKELESFVINFKDKNGCSDSRIKYYCNETNLGISESRNKLLDLAQGEYIAIMDHDDISLPQRFEKQVEYLDTHPNVGVVATKTKCIPSNKIYKFPTESHDIKLAMFGTCPLVHPSAMIRKSVLKDNNIRYREEYSPSEDYFLWAELMPITEFYNIPEVLFNYRIYEDNTSKTQGDKMHDATIRTRAYMQENSKSLYLEFKQKSTITTRVKLFGVIPLFRIIKKEEQVKIYLFNLIPIISWKSLEKLK